MTKVKFPTRRSDGTFCVEVAVAVTTDDPQALASRVQDWWNSVWLPENAVWTRKWSSGNRDELRFVDDFRAPPEVALVTESELRFRLEGAATAKFWKDWLVSRILPDLREAFREVGAFKEVVDC